jgi:extracellular factor (EF) 3-hydroxypalmitic acid methyl ester biosynthesis protein
LVGASGHQAFFRPRRQRPSQFLSTAANLRVRIGSDEHSVVDLSSNGALLLVADDTQRWQPGEQLETALMLHGAEVQRMKAVMVRCEPGLRTQRVAIALRGSYFDVSALRALDAEANLRRELSAGLDEQTTLVTPAFRDVIARIAHFVQFHNSTLERHAPAVSSDPRAANELAAHLYPTVLSKFAQLCDEAAEISLEFVGDSDRLVASKRYVELMLTPLLMTAPIVKRSYTKPLGYPGDYLVMQQCYDNDFEGETVFAKVFHKVFVQHPMSASLLTRKQYVVDHMLVEHSRLLASDASAEFRVTSLGCGPAREVAEYIAIRGHWPGRARWRLFDQEERTLELAHESVQRRIAQSGAAGVVECINMSFGQLLKNRTLLDRSGQQHLVYSTGLFDYLAPRTARVLIAALYDTLAPGGLLLIGNAAGPNRHYFSPEFILDWTLVYRSRDEMYALASRVRDAEVHVEHEAGGAYWFLSLRKPQAPAVGS